MKIIDLSHIIKEEMPVFPGTEKPILEEANTIEKDGFKETLIKMYSHTGTHIDAPAHMLMDGLYLNEMNIDSFIGSACIIDVTGLETIEIKNLQPFIELIKKVDFVIFKTGYEKYWGSNEYFGRFPTLSKDSAKWLADYKLKGIGVDAISIDPMDSIDFPVHFELFENNMISIENLTNLDKIEKEVFILSVLPLRTSKADGSPVRAVAQILE
ncbi:MAG: cyclase family protein [Bacillota bacterium]|nr:cyclase family protein [Bacillota bacterium]